MIRNFVNKLQNRLDVLPGEPAQRLMMPKEGNVQRFDLNRKNARRGGVLILFYAKDNEVHIPLMERQDYDGTHSGQISLPGGKIEKQDRSIVQTALRETEEEIGVERQKVEVLGTLSDLYIPPSNFRVTPVVGFIEEMPSFVLDSREVKSLIETPLSRIVHPEYRKWTQLNVRNYRLHTPYFDIEDRVVWGATAMILSELAEIIKPIKFI